MGGVPDRLKCATSMQPMRVLIIGATRALGPPLVRRLKAAGHDTVVLTRSPDAKPMLEPLGVPVSVADNFDRDSLVRATRAARPDAIVHLLIPWAKDGPRRMSDQAALIGFWRIGTANAVQAAAAAGVSRLVAESSITAYGYGDLGDRLLTEEDGQMIRYMPLGRWTVTRDTRGLERQALRGSVRSGLKGSVLRFGNFYGPGTRLAELPGRGWPLVGGGRGVTSWIHVEDAAAAIHAALELGGAGEIYNIVDDLPVSYRDFVTEMCRLAGAPPPREVPYLLGWLRAPVPAFQMARGKLRVSNAKARRELRWTPSYPTFHEGLRSLGPPPAA